MRKRPVEVGDWQIPYLSLMLIILTFMVVLCSISEISAERFRLAVGSVRELIKIAPEKIKEIEERRKKILEELEKVEKKFPEIDATLTSEGIILDIKEAIFFEIAKAELKKEAYPVLEKVAQITKKVNPSEIEVGGYTCDLPIHTKKFPSNWELSTARALSVTKQLKKLLPDIPIAAVGYGEFRPKVPNTSENNRKLNRRVEIYLRYGKRR